MNQEEKLKATLPEDTMAAASALREAARERQYVQRFEGKDIQYETVRGVTYPVEPGMSKLRREVERKKALKRMKQDDITLARLQRAIDDQNRTR